MLASKHYAQVDTVLGGEGIAERGRMAVVALSFRMFRCLCGAGKKFEAERL